MKRKELVVEIRIKYKDGRGLHKTVIRHIDNIFAIARWKGSMRFIHNTKQELLDRAIDAVVRMKAIDDERFSRRNKSKR